MTVGLHLADLVENSSRFPEFHLGQPHFANESMEMFHQSHQDVPHPWIRGLAHGRNHGGR